MLNANHAQEERHFRTKGGNAKENPRKSVTLGRGSYGDGDQRKVYDMMMMPGFISEDSFWGTAKSKWV